MTITPGGASKGAPGNPLASLDRPLNGGGEFKAGTFDVGGTTVGMDDVRRAVSQRPHKVLDAIRQMCETQETLIADYILSPLVTEEQIRVAEGKRNRIIGLQTVLQTFLESLFEEDEKPDDEQRN